MSAQTGVPVNNTIVNLGQVLKMVQIGNMHGHLSIYLGEMGLTETEEVLEDYQRYLVDTFCPADPTAFEHFQKVFEDGRWGILVGEPGDGRETAAIALHSSCELRVHAISLDEKPHDRLARTFPVAGIGYLIDLSSLGRTENRLVRELRALKTRVVENGAALTVLARPGTYTEELPEAPVFPVRRPWGIDVLSAHVGHFFDESTRNAWLTWAAVRALMYEVHPELSFRTMADTPLRSAKRTWNGQRHRCALLAEKGVELADDLGAAGKVAVDDILDAAAAAWSAHRIVVGRALSCPTPARSDASGGSIAIWY